jgi:uracil-DNA glycosylase
MIGRGAGGTLRTTLAALVEDISACRICRDTPSSGAPLPHEPRPVLRVSTTARLCLCSQAPGTRVHASGVPFTDPSGDRLRQWMGVTPDEFYDVSRIAIVPMGFCFPGLDAHGSDLPPRRECAKHWRRQLFEAMPQFELILLIGSYAQRWHLGVRAAKDMTATVRAWNTNFAASVPVEKADIAGVNADAHAQVGPTFLPLPHPSWRNNGWLKRNSWFEAETVPHLRSEVRRLLA